jgi:hypothetical protein
MKDFLKQFRENLERRPEPPFEERDWQDLQKRLGQREQKRSLPLAWWWLALPLLLLSSGSTAFFYLEMKKTEQKIAALETRRDTVFLTKIIFKTDTIYQTRIARQATYLALDPRFDNFLKVVKSSAQEQKFELLPALNSVGVTASHPDTTAQVSFENQHVAANFDQLPLPELLPLRSPSPPLPEVFAEPVFSKKKKTLEQHLYPLRPKGFQLGVVGGWAFPFSEEVKQQGGFSAGLQAAIEFSPRLQMWLDATYFKTSFETDRMGDDIGVPPVDPPSDQLAFLAADVPQSSWQYSVGMQYLFGADKKFKPLAGMGWGAVSLLPYEVIYEFENQALGIEWSFEKTMPRQELLTNFLFLRTGFEHQFSKKWTWQLLATYRAQFGETDFQTPNLLSIQGGFFRRF